MEKFRCVFCIAAALLAAGVPELAAETATKRPNIILIMSDDMGYSDLGCYGGDAKTPNLDALAAGGIRFTQFYNTARCCPTRASLMSGLYPHQAGIGHMGDDRGYDGYRGELNQDCATIPEVLGPAGYKTYMLGKWHVTHRNATAKKNPNWPTARGFDYFYGTKAGAGNYFDPPTLHRQTDPVDPAADPLYKPDQYYYTDALSDNAVKFLQKHQAETPSQPFFMYVAYTAAHWPMQALEKDIAKYRGQFDDGYAPHRLARLERMKKLGVVSPDSKLTPADEDWKNVAHKEWEARCMEVYCAMIDNMDAGIGRIVEQLKKEGQLDNTIIFYLQDNGACAENVGRAPNSRPGNAPSGRPVLTGPDHMPGPGETFIAYGRGWANVSNTPFREYKHWVHEGGISTPLIAHWPAGISADRRGKLEAQPGHLIDIMATCADLGSADFPKERNGKAIKPMEGVSLRPAFAGQALNRSQPLFWEHEGNRAVREGRWKLVAKENAPWELYDIETDRTELNNLAESQPDRVKDLAAKWDAYAARANVLPLGAWRGTGNPGGSSKKHFQLDSGAALKGKSAPDIARKGFTIQANFDVAQEPPVGVIVAQGGTALGFTLYVDDSKPSFLVRTQEGVFTVTGPKLSKGKHSLTARLSSSGELSMELNGKEVGKAAGNVIEKQPVDGLNVGMDDAGAVGDYESPNAFNGTVESVTIDLTSK